jgi:hypothetical protein
VTRSAPLTLGCNTRLFALLVIGSILLARFHAKVLPTASATSGGAGS